MASKHLSEDEIRYTVVTDTQQAQKELYQLKQKTKELEKEEKARRNQMIELEAQGKKNSKAWKNLKQSAEQYRQQIRENNKRQAELTKQLDISSMTMAQLKKRSKDLQRELDNMSQAASPKEYAELEESLKRVNGRISELRQNAKGMREVLASDQFTGTVWANVFMKAADAIGVFISKIHGFIDESTDMAASVDGISRAFEQMNNPNLLNNLRKATKGTVNDMELMKAAVQAKDFRIPLEDLGKYLQFAQLKAQQTGQSVDYMTYSIVTGLGRKSPMILDNLGISAAEISEKTKETGDFMLAVASIVENQLAEAGETYVSAADRATQRTVALQNKQLDLGKALLPLKEMWLDAYGAVAISIMDVIRWMATHKQMTLLLTIAVAGFTVAMTTLNAQLKTYILNSKAVLLMKAGWQTTLTTLKGFALLASAAFNALSGNVTRASAAIKILNNTCKANIFILIATAVAAAAVALYNYYKKATEVSEVVKQLNKTQERLALAMGKTNQIILKDQKDIEQQINNSTAKEITQIETLRKTVENSNKSYEERKNALEALQRIVPSYHAELTTEGKLINNNVSALTDYVKQLRKAAMEQAIFSKMTSITENTLNHQLLLQQREGNRKYAIGQAKKQGVDLETSEVRSTTGTSFNHGTYKIVQQYGVYDKDTGKLIKELDKSTYESLKSFQELVQYNDARIQEEKTYIEQNSKRIQNLESLASQNGVKPGADVSSLHQPGTIGEAIEKVKAEIEALNAERLTIKEGDTKGLEKIDKKLQELQKKKAQLEGSSVKTPTSGTKNSPKTNNADTEIASTFNKSRSADVDAENRAFQAELNALKQHLVQKEITEEQYNVKEQAAKVAHQARLLEIETQYAEQSQSLQISDAGKKEELVNRQNKNLENAQQRSFDAQIEAQRTFQNLMEKLQGAANNETSTNPTERLEAEKKAQLTVLQGYYEASKEYAEQNGLEVQDIEIAYQKAKENLDTQYAEKRKSLEQKTQQELFQIRQQYGLVTQQELYEQQLLLLEQHLEEGKLMEEDYEKAKSRLKRDFYKQQFDNYQSLFHDAVSALQDAEIANINAKYDAEIEAAKGNEEEVERLENEKAQKTLDIQKKYADVNFAIKASQIIADTTVSIMKAYADLGPIAGSVAAALMAVTGAAQLAAANAERKKVKKMTLGNSGGSESKTGARVATGFEKGGRIDVVREQDGKEFPNAEYAPDRRGFIDHPTVIVGEGPVGHSKEFVASNEAVENPTIAPVLAAIDQAQRAGNVRTLDLSKVLQLPAFSGRASGGSVDTSTQPDAATPSSAMSMSADEKKLLQELYALLRHLVDNGVDAFVILSELEKKQQLRDKARNIGSK